MTTITKGLLAAGGALIVRNIARKLREYNFRDKVVVITVSSRGLGLVLAREFAKQKARLAICARDIDELARARQDLQARHAEVLAIECDVTKRLAVNEFLARVRDKYGRIDVLVKVSSQNTTLASILINSFSWKRLGVANETS